MSRKDRKKVAIIGCGPSGMALLTSFRSAELKGGIMPEIVCYEKQGEIGGLWNYTWRTGQDEYGENVHGSMYRSLWSNGPKECLEMADYTFDEHFIKAVPSFPPRIALRNYLMGRANKYGIDKFVRLSTAVRYVEEISNGMLKVISENLKTKEKCSETFDYVVVATGHFSTPNFPSYPGLEEFSGRILHSHDFRKSEEFKNQTIVLIGSSYSAEDIALQLFKYGAKECIISYRTNPMGFKWPKGVREVPKLLEIEGNTCYFEDGSKVVADAVIFCTGYKHQFPFLSDNIQLSATNIMFPDNLYKGIVYENNDHVLYLGMQDQYYTFSMFDAQAWFARDFILEKIPVKNKEERKAETTVWYERGQELKSAHDEIDFQRDYVADLLSYTDYPKHDNGYIADMFHEWKRHKSEDIMTYRDKCFTSPNTGTVGIPMKVPWIDAKNVSLEWFLNN